MIKVFIIYYIRLWSAWAIPTYRVYRLYDDVNKTLYKFAIVKDGISLKYVNPVPQAKTNTVLFK